MWIIQEPNILELWNKLHFEEKRTESIIIHYYSALEAGPAGTRAWLWNQCDSWHCILGTVLGIVCHCFSPPLEVPTFATMCLCVLSDARDPSSERWNCGRERCPVVILPKFRLPRIFRDLLHAANLRHGTDGFTSPPKEGVLRIFSP